VKIKPIVFFSSILAVLSLYYFLFETDSNSTIKDTNKKKAFHFEASNIKGIELTSKTKKIVIIKKNNEWILIKPVKKKASTKSVNEYLSMLSAIEIIMPVDDNPGDNSAFGLENPSIKITLQQKNIKTSLGIMVGDYNPNMTCAYAKTNTSPEIFLIGSLFKNDIDKDVIFFKKQEGN
jgi:hypothetical protein